MFGSDPLLGHVFSMVPSLQGPLERPPVGPVGYLYKSCVIRGRIGGYIEFRD